MAFTFSTSHANLYPHAAVLVSLRNFASPMHPAFLSPLRSSCLPARHIRCAAANPHDIYTLADYVPNFPRFGEPVREFIAPDVPLLRGFNADNMTRIFLPDLIDPGSIYAFLLFLSCAVAVVYLELGDLLNDFLQEREFETLEEDFLRQQERKKRRQERGKVSSSENGDDELEIIGPVTQLERARAERRRGLGWLALATAGAVWTAGVLNRANPFQP